MAKKKENKYKCASCERTYVAYESPCRDCKGIDTIKEIAGSTTSQKRVRGRWKRSERTLAKDMSAADGPDPFFKNIASSTGKVGHLTGLRFDTVSRTYTNEDKNRPLPKWLISAWILILQRSIDLKKNALLHVRPPNLPRTFKVNGETFNAGTMAIITQEHHLELVKQARILSDLEFIIESDEKYLPLAEELWALKHR